MPNPDAHDLAPLLAGARAGDEGALNALLGKLRPYVHALVGARLGPDTPDTLDRSGLVQEGLMKIAGGIRSFRGQEVPQLLGWVGQIVRNLVTDAIRRRQREPKRVAGWRLLGQWARDMPDDQRDRRDRQAVAVAEALSRLGERRRRVIELSFLEGLDDAEIGRRLGGSAGAVRVLRFRALQELRQLLEDQPDSDCRSPRTPGGPGGQ
jgi:RNA polymerase sigma factor (sigma-70 family)